MIKERNWYKYYLIKDYEHTKKTSERLEATFDQLKVNKKKDNLLFNYSYFSNTHLYPIYNYLKKNYMVVVCLLDLEKPT